MKKLFENWRGFEKEVLEEETYAEKQRRQQNFSTYNRRPGGLNNLQSFIDGEGAPAGAIRAAAIEKSGVDASPEGYTGTGTPVRREADPNRPAGGEFPGQIAGRKIDARKDALKTGVAVATTVGPTAAAAVEALGITKGLAASFPGIAAGLASLSKMTVGAAGSGGLFAGATTSTTAGTGASAVTTVAAAPVVVLAGTIIAGGTIGAVGTTLALDALGFDSSGKQRIVGAWMRGLLGMEGDLDRHQTVRLQGAINKFKADAEKPEHKQRFQGPGLNAARKHALIMIALHGGEPGTESHEKYKNEIISVINRDHQLSKEGAQSGEYYAKMVMAPRATETVDGIKDEVWSIAQGTESEGRVAGLMALDSSISEENFEALIGRSRSENEIVAKNSKVKDNLTAQILDPTKRAEGVTDGDALNNLVNFAWEAGDAETAMTAGTSPSEGGTWEEKHTQDDQDDQTQADYDEDYAHLYGDEAGQSDTGPPEESELPADDASELDSDYDPSEHFAMKEETKRKPKLSITKARLAQIIKEELAGLKTEGFFDKAKKMGQKLFNPTLEDVANQLAGPGTARHTQGIRVRVETNDEGGKGLLITVPAGTFGVHQDEEETEFFTGPDGDVNSLQDINAAGGAANEWLVSGGLPRGSNPFGSAITWAGIGSSF